MKIKSLPYALAFCLLPFASSDAAQVIREEVIPSTITRDSEINPSGTTNEVCVSNTPGPTPVFGICSTLDLSGKTVTLPSNSVGNSQMQDNAVNTAEIANDAVTAAKVNKAGDFDWTGRQNAGGEVRWSGDITPTQLSGASTNNYSPTGLSTAAVLRLDADQAHTITGLAGGADGRWLVIHNVGSFALTLAAENASSSAANRFACPANVTLLPNASVKLQYDSTSSRWRCIGGAGGHVVTSALAPQVDDDGDDGYIVGTVWIKTDAPNQVFIAESVASGAANWIDITPAGIAAGYKKIIFGETEIEATGPEDLVITSSDGTCSFTLTPGDPDQWDFSCGGTIAGSGTAGFLPKFDDPNTLGNSIIKQVDTTNLEVGDVSTNSFVDNRSEVTGHKVQYRQNANGTVALVSREFPFAGCNNTTAGSIWDLPTSNAATAVCVTGTNTQQGALNFANGQSAQMHFYLPPLNSSAVANLVLIWADGETSATGTWALQAVCTPLNDSATDDPAFGTFWAPSQDTSSGTANRVKATTGTDVALPASCVGGNVFMHLKLSWTAGTATDFRAKTLYVRF